MYCLELKIPYQTYFIIYHLEIFKISKLYVSLFFLTVPQHQVTPQLSRWNCVTLRKKTRNNVINSCISENTLNIQCMYIKTE